MIAQDLWVAVDLVLGQGSYGEVFKVEKTVDHDEHRERLYNLTVPKTYALKLIDIKGGSEITMRRIMCELATLKYLTALTHKGHSYFPKLYYDPILYPDSGVSVEMELCDITLHNILRRHPAKYEPLIIGQIKRITLQLLEGLEFIHTHGILHGDLTPENISVDDTLNVKILDLGMAILNHQYSADQPEGEANKSCKSFTRSPSTGNDVGVTARWYRSSEIIANNTNYDCRADIWSLGCIILEMISVGEVAVPGSDTLDQLHRNIGLSCAAAQHVDEGEPKVERPWISDEDIKVVINTLDIIDVDTNKFLPVHDPVKEVTDIVKQPHNTLAEVVVALATFPRIKSLLGADAYNELNKFCSFIAPFLHFNWKERLNATELLTDPWLEDGKFGDPPDSGPALSDRLTASLSESYMRYMTYYIDGSAFKDGIDMSKLIGQLPSLCKISPADDDEPEPEPEA